MIYDFGIAPARHREPYSMLFVLLLARSGEAGGSLYLFNAQRRRLRRVSPIINRQSSILAPTSVSSSFPHGKAWFDVHFFQSLLGKNNLALMLISA
jgi:hypothetical protein